MCDAQMVMMQQWHDGHRIATMSGVMMTSRVMQDGCGMATMSRVMMMGVE